MPDRVDLKIGGMTCATCAARVEKKLNRMAGVEATVNFATEVARVAYTGPVTIADLVKTVEATGYTAQPDRPGHGRPGQDRPGHGRPGQDRPGRDRPGQDRHNFPEVVASDPAGDHNLPEVVPIKEGGDGARR